MSIKDNLLRDARKRLGQLLSSQTGNAPVMMMLGGFKFAVNTAAFTEVQRSQAFRWSGQERFGQMDALQFTGYGMDRITLPCVVFPDWQGITGTWDILDKAPENTPQRLISASGRVIGRFVIESLEETHTHHKTDGTPRKIEFTLTIRGYD